MARMIPPYCPDDAPPGENELFRALAADRGTDGWIVLHSLAIASHVRQVQGEADFVVIVPDRGIAVIEVKSHTDVRRESDGRWKLGAQPPTARGPFQQASESLHSITNYLKKQNVDLRSVPVVAAVWFTHVRARAALPSSPEWHDWQLLDSVDLRNGAPAAVLRTISRGTEHLDSRLYGFSYGGVGPDPDAAARIATVLRPKFEAAVAPGDVRRARETQLTAFIDEQYDALDNMQHNRAVLFTGPAGSGKTWLAMEAARREVELGRSGRLLCFNNLLGQRLRNDLAGVKGLQVSTFHQEALRLVGQTAPTDPGPCFWNSELPERALEALLDSTFEPSDFLVLDEVQDLARPEFLDVLDLMVKGGLAGGRLLLFGDFERQAIYEVGDGREELLKRAGQPASYQLTVNCRNLPRIGTVVKTLSHMSPGYRRFRRADDGTDPEFVTFNKGDDQSAALAAAVRKLRDDAYGLDEIVVLSPHRAGSTAETTTDPWLRQVLHRADGRPPRPGQLRYTTIHSYKGLDAPAVVVTDLNDAWMPRFESLLYIGMTRATDRLTMIIETETLRVAFGRHHDRG